MATAHALMQSLDALESTLCVKGHRALLVLEGAADQCHQAAVGLLGQSSRQEGSILWVGRPPAVSLPHGVAVLDNASLRRRLGTEIRVLLVDAFSGFDPEAFCIGAGMVVGGGLVVLMVPPLSDWPAWPDPDLARLLPEGYLPPSQSLFLAWMQRCLMHASFAFRLAAAECRTLMSSREEHDVGRALDVINRGANAPERIEQAAMTRQDGLFQALMAILDAPMTGPVWVRAERGRGKSSLLGRILSVVCVQRDWRVRVTGPDQRAVSRLLDVAAIPGLGFTPFDALMDASFDLLVIDEAAGIPVPVLKHLVARCPRVVMASTLHGYEGSGQGLALRFIPWCERQGRPVQCLGGLLPMRWPEDDPLDDWLQDSFMLREAPPDAGVRVDSDVAQDMTLVHWPAFVFGECPDRLRAVMRLLTIAHYRTTPSDLRDLMDGPNLRVHVALHQDQVVGVVLLALEGPLADEALGTGIMAGVRRPRGHLLPQILAWHCQAPECLASRMARIVRIAVDPRCQGRGLGSAMLARLRICLTEEGIGRVGSSFAADPDVVRFWLNNGFRPVREGRRRDQAGGEASLVVLAATGGDTDDLVNELVAEHAMDRSAERALASGSFASDQCSSWAAAVLPQLAVATPRWRGRMSRFVDASLSLEAAWPALCRWWWMQATQGLAGSEPVLTRIFQSGLTEAAQGFNGGKRALGTWLRRRLKDEFRGTWSVPAPEHHQRKGESDDDK